ncbi:MAG: hypothetical protein EZS28_011576, partial [Streblomastix strix]
MIKIFDEYDDECKDGYCEDEEVVITSGDGLTALADGEDKTVSDPPPR